MENHLRLRDLLVLICAPVLALILCSCGEIIQIPDDAEALLPDHVLASILTTSTTAGTTTTVTIDPAWQERTVENYNGRNGVVIQGVPHYTQFTSYFTACESFASVSVLQYFGVDIDIERFVEKYLPKAAYPDVGKDGEMHGASPWEFFIGDPRDPGGFGCYNTAISKAINKIADGLAKPLNGYSIDKLCSDFIDKGQPVIFWGTIYMQRPYVSEFHWILPDGKRYEFVNPEHALVLIGYDDDYYYFCDSMSGNDITPYYRKAVEAAYEGLSKQAVVIDPLILEAMPQDLRIPTVEAAEIAEEENGREAA